MKLRVLIITEMIAPYRIPVFNALAKKNDLEVHVVFLSETDSMLRQWVVYKKEIQFSYQVLPSWRRRIGNNHMVLLNRGLCAALSRWQPKVVILGGYNYLSSWQTIVWARKHDVPLVLWCESNLNDRRSNHILIKFMKRMFLRRSDGFVVPGKASFEYLMTFGISPNAISTAPNAVDIGLFARGADWAKRHEAEVRREFDLPSRFFLFVGRLVPEKGVFDFLEAYQELDSCLRSEVSLVFAGGGAGEMALLRRASHIKPGRVQFVGFIQREQLPSYYGLAEGFVFPTRSDPWGLVVNEAMACGLPVVVSRVAGCTADLVRDGWNGYIVSPGDISKIGESMRALAEQPALAKRMGLRSADHIRHYSPEACAAGLARAALQTLERKRW